MTLTPDRARARDRRSPSTATRTSRWGSCSRGRDLPDRRGDEASSGRAARGRSSRTSRTRSRPAPRARSSSRSSRRPGTTGRRARSSIPPRPLARPRPVARRASEACSSGRRPGSTALDLYPRPVRIGRVRLFVCSLLFRLPWFRRFDGYAAWGDDPAPRAGRARRRRPRLPRALSRLADAAPSARDAPLLSPKRVTPAIPTRLEARDAVERTRRLETADRATLADWRRGAGFRPVRRSG